MCWLYSYSDIKLFREDPWVYQTKMNVSFINDLEYLLIVIRYSCKARGITLKDIFLELCPFLSKNYCKFVIGTACSALNNNISFLFSSRTHLTRTILEIFFTHHHLVSTSNTSHTGTSRDTGPLLCLYVLMTPIQPSFIWSPAKSMLKTSNMTLWNDRAWFTLSWWLIN